MTKRFEFSHNDESREYCLMGCDAVQSGMLCLLAIFSPEDGGSTFLRNVGEHAITSQGLDGCCI
jgi:hypothetical protein